MEGSSSQATSGPADPADSPSARGATAARRAAATGATQGDIRLSNRGISNPGITAAQATSGPADPAESPSARDSAGACGSARSRSRHGSRAVQRDSEAGSDAERSSCCANIIRRESHAKVA